MVADRWLPLTGFAYGDIDSGSFADLTPCPKCDTLPRLDEIDEANLKQGIPEERVEELRAAYDRGSAYAEAEEASVHEDVAEAFADEEEVSIVIK